MNINKSLCDWSKSEISRNQADLAKLVRKAEFMCTKCARAAKIDSVLCKPVRIKKQKK